MAAMAMALDEPEQDGSHGRGGPEATSALTMTSDSSLGSLDLAMLDERLRQSRLLGLEADEVVSRIEKAQERRRQWLDKVDTARRALWSALEDSSTLLATRKVDHESVLQYASLIASSSSAPAGYSQDGGAGQMIQLPYPDEAMMRRGRLGAASEVSETVTEQVKPTAAAAPSMTREEPSGAFVPVEAAPVRAPVLNLDLDSDEE